MLQDLIKDRIQEITEKLPLMDVYELGEFINADFEDEFVTNFIRAHIRLSLYSEYMKFDILSEGLISFNFSQTSFEDYCGYVVAHSQISYNSAEELIAKAVTAKHDFLVRPIYALGAYIFEGSATKGAFEILLSLHRFTSYHLHILEYANVEYESLAESVLFEPLSSSSFVNFIRSLDRRMHESSTIDNFCDYLKSISRALNFGDELLPVYVLNDILKDKSLYYLIDRLNEKYTMTDSLTINNFRDFLIELHNEMAEDIRIDTEVLQAKEFQGTDDDLLFEIEEKVKELTENQDEDFYLNDMIHIDNGNDEHIVHSNKDFDKRTDANMDTARE